MQGDLISRSALEKIVRQSGEDAGLHYSDWQKFLRWIRKAPAVDAVPVVRCKDCKHRGGYHCPMYHTETSLDDLDGFDDYNVDKTEGDGFCHRGERGG